MFPQREERDNMKSKRQNRPHTSYFRLSLIIFAAFFLQKAQAHKLALDVFVEGNRVRVEAYYPLDGSPALGASVRVVDSEGNLIAEGKTDASGAFTFVCEKKVGLVVEVEHGPHRATATVGEEPSPTQKEGTKGRPISSGRKESYPFTRVFSGVSVILSLTAFMLSVLSWKRTKRLEDLLRER